MPGLTTFAKATVVRRSFSKGGRPGLQPCEFVVFVVFVIFVIFVVFLIFVAAAVGPLQSLWVPVQAPVSTAPVRRACQNSFARSMPSSASE